MKPKIWIGIDPGVTTGLSVWHSGDRELLHVSSFDFWDAVEWLSNFLETNSQPVFVRFEDARLRAWFGNSGREKLQGAGSVKRDCQLWKNWLTRNQIPFQAVAPKNNLTKMNAAQFKKMTGWQERTNEHSRDAAMLVFGM